MAVQSAHFVKEAFSRLTLSLTPHLKRAIWPGTSIHQSAA
jgi:hypothetical protein